MTDPLRLTGLFSTFDVEGVISQLTLARSGVLTKIDQKTAVANAKKTSLATVQSRFISLLAKASALANATSVSGKTATVTGSGVSASAGPSASTGTFTVDVLKLATATKMGGSAISSGIDATVPLGESNFASTPTNGTFTIKTATGGTKTFSVGAAAADSAALLSGSNFTTAVTAGTFTLETATGGSQQFTIDPSTQSLDDVLALINGSGIGVTATVSNDANGRANMITLSSTQGAITVGASGDTSNFLAATNLSGSTGTTERTSTAAFTKQMSLNQVIADINASGIGVTASITNDANGRANVLTLDSTQGAITLGNAGDTSTFLAATNLLASPGTDTRQSTLGIARMRVTEKMAEADWDGGPPASGPQSFTINGATISYDVSTDSLFDVISRINASTANVTARYDSVSDTVLIESNKVGSLGITLADDGSGDLLAKLGLVNATQTLGQNAEYKIDGGETQFSASNTVTLGNGVSLTLSATSNGSPATVSVTQDANSAVTAMKGFVEELNKAFEAIDAATKADPSRPGSLSGDSSLRYLKSNLRALVTAPGTNIEGKYQRLDQIGVSFGAVGSAIGTTNTLQFDEAKFRAALASDPASVQSLLSAYTLEGTLQPGGTGSISGLTGKYTGLTPGTYKLTDNGNGQITSEFRPANGSTPTTSTFTVQPNGTVSGIIPGMTLQVAGTLTAGTHTITVGATQRSPLMALKEQLDLQAGAGGVLDKRQDTYTAVTKRLSEERARAEDRIAHEMSVWRKKFQEMELAQMRYASIANSLAGALAQMQANSQA